MRLLRERRFRPQCHRARNREHLRWSGILFHAPDGRGAAAAVGGGAGGQRPLCVRAGRDPSRESDPCARGIGPEARRALENVKGVLERHGSSLEQVAKCTVFLADIKEWPAFNKIYREYFKTNLPARSAVAVSGLAFGARVEVECVAYVPSPLSVPSSKGGGKVTK
jgi:enamine deaminase RidA (YjgF/YER057c/UK114 family)